MKNLLPPKPHSKETKNNAQKGRNGLGRCLICIGLFLAAVALKASVPIHRPPYITFISDQRVTTPGQGFATQYFRIIDFDGLGFVKMKRSSTSFYLTSAITIQPCTSSR